MIRIHLACFLDFQSEVPFVNGYRLKKNYVIQWVFQDSQNQGDEYYAVFDPRKQVTQQGVSNTMDFDQITVNLEIFKVQRNKM